MNEDKHVTLLRSQNRDSLDCNEHVPALINYFPTHLVQVEALHCKQTESSIKSSSENHLTDDGLFYFHTKDISANAIEINHHDLNVNLQPNLYEIHYPIQPNAYKEAPYYQCIEDGSNFVNKSNSSETILYKNVWSSLDKLTPASPLENTELSSDLPNISCIKSQNSNYENEKSKQTSIVNSSSIIFAGENNIINVNLKTKPEENNEARQKYKRKRKKKRKSMNKLLPSSSSRPSKSPKIKTFISTSPCMINIYAKSSSKECHEDNRKKSVQEISPTVREMMAQLVLSGVAINAVAKHYNVCRNTVGTWVKRQQQFGTTITKHRAGRPRLTSKKQDKEILSLTNTDEKTCPKSTLNAAIHSMKLPCSVSTLRRRIKEEKFPKHTKFKGDERKERTFETTRNMRETMVQMALSGMPVQEVARQLNVGRNTVGKWLKRHREAGSLKTLERKGRPRVTDESQDEQIVNLVETGIKCNSKISTKHAKDTLQLNCSTVTIKRRLKEKNVKLPVKNKDENSLFGKPQKKKIVNNETYINSSLSSSSTVATMVDKLEHSLHYGISHSNNLDTTAHAHHPQHFHYHLHPQQPIKPLAYVPNQPSSHQTLPHPTTTYNFMTRFPPEHNYT